MNWESATFWQNQEVLLTGGTGSLGKAITNLFIQENYLLKGLRIFSRDELKQYQMKQDITPPFPVSFLIGDIRNRARMTRAMEGVDICIHTAALKQVDTSEDNPWEFIETNVIGTQNVLDSCLDCNVKKAMLISTDKAVYPVNLYGMTKGCAERIFIHGNVYSGGGHPAFGCCRYGNVLGSRGSVVQLFQKQAQERQDYVSIFTITDCRMTRFWITLEQVAKFILRSIEQMTAGQTFIPKMPSMKITELARAVGFSEGMQEEEIDYEEIGIRPGEKLHECLVTEEESHKCAIKADHFLIHPTVVWPPEAPRFTYTSDKNDWILSGEELIKMIEK